MTTPKEPSSDASAVAVTCSNGALVSHPVVATSGETKLPTWYTIISTCRQNHSAILVHIVSILVSYVSPSPSCLRCWLGSLVYVRVKGPSSEPSYGAHWHGPTQPTT